VPYAIKEIYYTLQGEGANSGRAAVFCRFAGCNLWSGREANRAEADCQFCDTDFVGTDGPGGGHFVNAWQLADAIATCWPTRPRAQPFVVCTGGEPLLQIDPGLVDALHDMRFRVAIETNGTLPAPRGIDWICMSPKAGSELKLVAGDELKLVFPQPGGEPERYQDMAFEHFFLQPMDGPDLARNTELAAAYCLRNPHWRLSLQIHKLAGLR